MKIEVALPLEALISTSHVEQHISGRKRGLETKRLRFNIYHGEQSRSGGAAQGSERISVNRTSNFSTHFIARSHRDVTLKSWQSHTCSRLLPCLPRRMLAIPKAKWIGSIRVSCSGRHVAIERMSTPYNHFPSPKIKRNCWTSFSALSAQYRNIPSLYVY